MNPEADYCPGCGAQVYPEETHCPFCGHKLGRGVLTPVLLGVAGAVLAVVSGGLVWWVMSSPSMPGLSQASAPAATQQAAPSAAASAPPATQAALKTDTDRAPGLPAASPAAARDGATSADAMPDTFGPDPSTAPATQDEPATVASLPREDTNPPPDAETRRLFAQSTQEKFTQNGLDLSVSTAGPDGTTLNIKFNFPAKTAAELIAAGPFPRQCEQRGFKQVVFLDPSGAAWVYDMASSQLTQR